MFFRLSLYPVPNVFWDNLEDELRSYNLPWVLMGDLNEVVEESEKMGGRAIWKRRLFFKPCIQALGAVDLGFVGKKFTWENRQTGKWYIKERLD